MYWHDWDEYGTNMGRIWDERPKLRAGQEG